MQKHTKIRTELIKTKLQKEDTAAQNNERETANLYFSRTISSIKKQKKSY